jgi:hypothetical protein
MSAKPALAALVLALAVGASACGKDHAEPKVGPGSSATTGGTDRPTSGSTASDGPGDGTSPTSPAVGLPADFPAQRDVPLVAGVVTSKTGGKDPDGRIGWVIEMSAVGTQKGCFDRAAAALVAAGFAKQGEMTAQDTRQAQFTTKKWAVIISSRADGENCQLGYEVGQLTG